MAIQSYTTQEFADFFGMTRQGLKKMIENNNLDKKLSEKGYRLLDVTKQGRKVIYRIEETVTVTKETWEQYTKKEFPTVRKINSLGDYCEERLVKQTPTLLKDLSKKVGVTPKTVTNWDNMLVEKGIMKYNGYIYFRLTFEGLEPITYQQYMDYWNTSKADNKIKKIKNELRNIIESEDKESTDQIINSIGTCIKVKSYLIHQFTQKYEELIGALNNREKVKQSA